MLMAIDKSNGRMVGNWALGGITHIDYEDISNGPGPKPDLNYLHLCDIGDNPRIEGQSGSTVSLNLHLLAVSEPKTFIHRLSRSSIQTAPRMLKVAW